MKEREEDMAKISQMIKVGVREEVETAIKPIDVSLVGQEKVSEELGSQMMMALHLAPNEQQVGSPEALPSFYSFYPTHIY